MEVTRRDALKLVAAAAASAALPATAVACSDDELKQAQTELLESCEQCEQMLCCPTYELPYPEHIKLHYKPQDSELGFRWPLVFDLNADLDRSTLLHTKDMRRLAGVSRIKLKWDEDGRNVRFTAYCWPANLMRGDMAVAISEPTKDDPSVVYASACPVCREFQMRYDISEYWLAGIRWGDQAADCATEDLVNATIQREKHCLVMSGSCDLLQPAGFDNKTLKRLGVPSTFAFDSLGDFWDPAFGQSYTNAPHWLVNNIGKPLSEWTNYGFPISGVVFHYDDDGVYVHPTLDLDRLCELTEPFVPMNRNELLANYASFEISLMKRILEDFNNKLLTQFSLPAEVTKPGG